MPGAAPAAGPPPGNGPGAAPGSSITQDLGTGFVKGAGTTAIGAGQMVNELSRSPMGVGTPIALLAKVMGFPEFDPRAPRGISDAIMPGALDQAELMMTPKSGAESVGYVGEKIAEVAPGAISAVKAAPGMLKAAAQAAMGRAPMGSLLAKLLPFATRNTAVPIPKPPAGTIANQFAKMQGNSPVVKATLGQLQSAAQKAAAAVTKARGRGAVPGHGFVPRAVEEAGKRAAMEADFAKTMADESRDVKAIREFLDASGKAAGREAAGVGKGAGRVGAGNAPAPPKGPATNASTAARTVKQPASAAQAAPPSKPPSTPAAKASAPVAPRAKTPPSAQGAQSAPAPIPKPGTKASLGPHAGNKEKLEELGRLLMGGGKKAGGKVAKVKAKARR